MADPANAAVNIAAAVNQIAQASQVLANEVPQLAGLAGLLDVPQQLQQIHLQQQEEQQRWEDMQLMLQQMQQDFNRMWNATCAEGVLTPYRAVLNQQGGQPPQPPITSMQVLLALTPQQLNSWLVYYLGDEHVAQHFGPNIPQVMRQRALAQHLGVRILP
eukprot:tig00020539_g10433.t1